MTAQLRKLPFNRLFHHPRKNILVLTRGNKFYVLNSATGSLIAAPVSSPVPSSSPTKAKATTFNAIQDEKFNADTIRTGEFDPTGKYFITTGEDKVLNIWECDRWGILNERPAHKRGVAIRFTNDGDRFIVGDKFGDVWSYKTADESHTGDLILGHVSMLTDLLLSPTNKSILTADRDEKVRVSKFPKGHIIVNYCLGHTQFVSTIQFHPKNPSVLISGGGDNFLTLWDWKVGSLKEKIELTPYLKKAPVEDEITITRIKTSKISGVVAVIVEKYPGILIFKSISESDTSIEYVQTVTTPVDPVDIEFDPQSDNLWVSLNTLSPEKEVSESIMVVKFNTSENKFTSSDPAFSRTINKLSIESVEINSADYNTKLEEIYTTGNLRKTFGEDLAEEGDDGGAARRKKGKPKGKGKGKGTKNNGADEMDAEKKVEIAEPAKKKRKQE